MIAAAAVLGAVVGSFAGVVAHRVPRGESLGGRSRCACGRTIPAWENVPVIAYAALGGRARCCRTPIGWWNLGIELCYAAAAAAAYAAAGWPAAGAALAALLTTTWLAALAATAELRDQ